MQTSWLWLQSSKTKLEATGKSKKVQSIVVVGLSVTVSMNIVYLFDFVYS